jgi:hypothetical protein
MLTVAVRLLFDGILAELVLGAMAYLAWVSIERLAPISTSLRWLSWAVMMQFWISVGFHTLLLTNCFNVAGAVVWSVLCSGVAYTFQRNRPVSLRTLFRQPVLLWRWMSGSIRRERAAYLILPAVVVQILICFVRPAQGDDYFVYHGLKAALWVQQGLHYDYDSPSGWTLYRNFPGGGSISTAWIMLLFQSDRFTGLASVLYWPFYCLAAYVLARELSIRSREAWVLALFLSCMPSILDHKGGAFIDTPMHAIILAGLAFAVHAIRHGKERYLPLIGIAAGLAASMKIPSYPYAAILMASPALLLFQISWRRLMAPWALGIVLTASMLFPWFYYAYLNTGYPFSPVSVHIGSIILGKAPMTADAYLHLVPPPGSFPWRDIHAFFVIFFTRNPQTLDLYVLVLLFLAPVGWIRLLKFNWKIFVLLAIVGVYYLELYFSPIFIVNRLVYPWVNGRFFLAPVSFTAMIGYLAFPRFQRFLCGFLFIVVVYEVNFFAFRDYQPTLVAYLPAFGLLPISLGLLLLGSYWFLGRRILFRGWPLAKLSLVFPAWLLVCGLLSDECRRGFHEPEAGWPDGLWKAVSLTDSLSDSYKIDVTISKYASFNQIYALPLMGRQLQNRLVYVPISKSGKIYENVDPLRLDDIDFTSWENRLLAEHVDAIMSFSPRSIEMDWMENHPELFQKMAGESDPLLEKNNEWRFTNLDQRNVPGWGLYRFIPCSRIAPNKSDAVR